VSGESAFDVDNITLAPYSTNTFKFRLKAPIAANLEFQRDENGELILDAKNNPLKVDLEVDYEFSVSAEDPCVNRSLIGASGVVLVPYKKAADHIIVNKKVSTLLQK
jgi:hypothetical protein